MTVETYRIVRVQPETLRAYQPRPQGTVRLDIGGHQHDLRTAEARALGQALLEVAGEEEGE